MKEVSSSQQLSTEVVGRLTDAQRSELTTLGLSIFDARKLDPENSEHIPQVQRVLEDCVYRGLEAQKRQWFGSSERVSPIFELGLRQREKIVDQLKSVGEIGTVLKYITSEEGAEIDESFVLDPNFEKTDNLYTRFKDRRSDVSKFHNALFVESQLEPKASAIKKSIDVIAHKSISSQDREWMKNNMLYGNLLFNLALYQQVDLTIEPKDIAAISDMWKDTDLRERRQVEIIERMKEIGVRLNIPVSSIESYTRSILEDINSRLPSGRVTLEELASTGLFAIMEETIIDENREFMRFDEDAPRVVEVTKEDLSKARSKFLTVYEMYRQIDNLSSETDDKYADENIIPFFQKAEPISLYLMYHRGLEEFYSKEYNYRRLEEDLQELVPFSTYLNALIMLQAKEFKIAETGEDIPEFGDKTREDVYTVIKRRVMKGLVEEEFGEDVDYDNVIGKLPSPILGDYIDIVDPELLPDDRIDTLYNVNDQKWVQIASSRGIYAVESQVDEGVIDLIYSPETDLLQGYFKRMPREKQKSIARKLLHTIVI
jgi:hypothetical protein